MAAAEPIREAFAIQAGWCDKLGSPFTARLCAVIGQNLDRSTAVGRRILDWPLGADVTEPAVPLRIAGGLHALVRAGRLPALARLYPPNALPSEEALWHVVSDALLAADADLLPWLDSAPQTNEVARAGVLMAGLLAIADRTKQPLALFELGASAGLNLILDRYAYRLGSRSFGPAQAALTLTPDWTGGDPTDAPVVIAERRGVDLNPLDVGDPAARERLVAFVWPDQPERIARMEAALALAAADPPVIDREDAAGWIERWITPDARPGTTRVVLHSIAFQYFPPDSAARIAARMEEAGRVATEQAPLAWLRYEHDAGLNRPTLRLRLWPDGSDRLLAHAHPHGRSVAWLG